MFKCYSPIINGCLYILGRKSLVADHYICRSMTLKIKWANHSCNSQSSLFVTSSTLFQNLCWFVYQKTDLLISYGSIKQHVYIWRSTEGAHLVCIPRERAICVPFTRLCHISTGAGRPAGKWKCHCRGRLKSLL